MTKLLRAPRIGSTAKLSPSVSGFIFNESRDSILLVRRADNGRWCLPSGHIEPGESIVEACQREVREETGLDTVFKELLGVWSDPDIIMEYADGNRFQCLEIDLEMEVISGELTPSKETRAFQYVALGRLSSIAIMETEIERINLATKRGAGYVR